MLRVIYWGIWSTGRVQLDLLIRSVKGSLISEGIFDFGSIGKKGAKSLPWGGTLNFLLFTVNNLFKFSDQGSDLAPFIGNGTNVKIPSEIKPPLNETVIEKKWKI